MQLVVGQGRGWSGGDDGHRAEEVAQRMEWEGAQAGAAGGRGGCGGRRVGWRRRIVVGGRWGRGGRRAATRTPGPRRRSGVRGRRDGRGAVPLRRPWERRGPCPTSGP